MSAHQLTLAHMETQNTQAAFAYLLAQKAFMANPTPRDVVQDNKRQIYLFEAVEEYLVRYAYDRDKASAGDDKCRLDIIKDHVGDMPLEDFGPETLDDLMYHLRHDRGVSNSTANKYWGILRSMMNILSGKGYRVQKLTFKKYTEHARNLRMPIKHFNKLIHSQFFDSEQYSREQLRQFIKLAYLTGMRRGEITNL